MLLYVFVKLPKSCSYLRLEFIYCKEAGKTTCVLIFKILQNYDAYIALGYFLDLRKIFREVFQLTV